jgi:hypothetical protein
VEEDFAFGKDCFGLDQSADCRHQARSRWYHQRTRLTREIALVS